MEDVLVIGGGLAGLTSALGLAAAGLKVSLVEKKNYPFHRVCGEYVSNEVLPFLNSLGVDLPALNPAEITRFRLTSPAGRMLEIPLDLGGFGLSRYTLDHYLYQLAEARGVTFYSGTSADSVTFANDKFTVGLAGGAILESRMVVGAFGKRANLDRQLNRTFFRQRTPYMAVKYHLRTNFPEDLIALHNFDNGYAGISAIEDGKFCFCYLTTRKNLELHKTVGKMEEKVLRRNPHLDRIFQESEFLYAQPEVINQISFAPKTAVENHILCTGDAAGLITPLCGNGMAMAIHSGKLVTEALVAYFQNHRNRQQLEQQYATVWQQHFGRRLQTGRLVQKLFGREVLSEIAVGALKNMPAAVNFLMRQTHGQPF